MSYSRIEFGKYAGKTLPQIIFHDPDWFFWAIDERVFDKYGSLAEEAQTLYGKARNIKIPDIEGKPRVAEYYVHPLSGKFCQLRLVISDQISQFDKHLAFRKNVIDLRVPRSICHYDKRGSRDLVAAAKPALFGRDDVRLTKDRCEWFFKRPENFVQGSSNPL